MFETEQANTDIHELCRQMITRIEKFGTLEGFADSDILEVLKSIKEILEPLPCLIEITAPAIVFGDIHGQLWDLLQFVKQVGRPPEFQYLLLGDYVDRASKSLEVISWLFCMKILFPKKVHLLRGNHEVRRVNALYGFKEELTRKRNDSMWKSFNDVFSELPICASINRKILCMHGGISPNIENWASLTTMNKARIHAECENGLAVDLMWSDPNRSEDKCQMNTQRGISCFFGKSKIEEICTALNIEMIIRAHEMKPKGFEFEFDNRLLTVFSAPHYAGNNSNSGSVVTISRSLKLQIVTLKPKKGQETMKMDRQTIQEFSNAFKPDDANKEKKITCQYNVPPSTADYSSQFLGAYSMFAHDTAHCKTDNEKATGNLKLLDPNEDNSVLGTIRKTMKGYGTEISLKDEGMSLDSIRRRLGMPVGTPIPIAPINTPTPDPPPPPPSPPPAVPPSPPNSAENS